jgi:hypothetical protein
MTPTLCGEATPPINFEEASFGGEVQPDIDLLLDQRDEQWLWRNAGLTPNGVRLANNERLTQNEDNHCTKKRTRCGNARVHSYCLDCHAICVETAAHCLTLGCAHASARHQTVLQDCAEICQTSANFMLCTSAPSLAIAWPTHSHDVNWFDNTPVGYIIPGRGI